MSDSGSVPAAEHRLASQSRFLDRLFDRLFLHAFDPSNPACHIPIVLLTTISTRIVYLAILSNCQLYLIPLFDSSPSIFTNEAFLRWDVFHFADVAVRQNYRWEHEYAFGFGMPCIMAMVAILIETITGKAKNLPSLLTGGIGLAWIAGMMAPMELYKLTRDVTQRPSFALLAALLYCFPSSPPALVFAPYTEPLFALASFAGMRDCVRRKYFAAVFKFGLATVFRANGLMLGGYIGWFLVAEPFLRTRRVSAMRCIYCLQLLAIVALPFAHVQISAYRMFCVDRTPARPWCSSLVPSIYSFVQEHYWNVGFLRYWTLSQLPNFLISAPVYALAFFSVHDTLSTHDRRRIPFAVHTLVFTLLLLFTANVQIALRQVSALPTPYWAAAGLLMGEKGSRQRMWGMAWLAWSVIWGVVSCALWVAFLPPA